MPQGLQRLDLSSNQFKELDLSQLPQCLKELYLDSNLFEQLNLAKLPQSLQIIDLGTNRLKELNLSHLQNLKVLYLCYNQLTKLDKLPQNLQTLDLNNNQLKELNLSQLPSSLQYLNLSSNPIEKVIGTKPVACIIFGLVLKIDLSNLETTNENCYICHMNEEETKNKVYILKCHHTHTYHQECLQSWINTDKPKKCVVCQTEF